jgi:hypothetical protein
MGLDRVWAQAVSEVCDLTCIDLWIYIENVAVVSVTARTISSRS